MKESQKKAMTYISKYRKNVRLVEYISREKELLNNMPQAWASILFEEQELQVKKTIEIWRNSFSYEYESLISIFPEYLKDVFLIEYDRKYSLIYEIGDKKTSHYYEGRNPFSKEINQKVKPLWDRVPYNLRRFYDTLHDGWCYLASDSMGLVPAKDFLVLDEQDWGILEDINVSINLENVLGVFSNGAGGYVCLDLNQDEPKGLLWWHDEAPDLTIDFWPTIDEWTVIGIQEDLEGH